MGPCPLLDFVGGMALKQTVISGEITQRSGLFVGSPSLYCAFPCAPETERYLSRQNLRKTRFAQHCARKRRIAIAFGGLNNQAHLRRGSLRRKHRHGGSRVVFRRRATTKIRDRR